MKRPVCVKCGRLLSDPFSIAVGMGPDCRGGLSRRGWTFPRPKWRPRKGQVVFDGYHGKIEPPTVMTEDDKKVMRRIEKRKAENEHRDQSES